MRLIGAIARLNSLNRAGYSPHSSAQWRLIIHIFALRKNWFTEPSNETQSFRTGGSLKIYPPAAAGFEDMESS